MNLNSNIVRSLGELIEISYRDNNAYPIKIQVLFGYDIRVIFQLKLISRTPQKLE
jgi:hypothetical protein